MEEDTGKHDNFLGPRILPDRPIDDAEAFDFSAYAQTIARLITYKEHEAPYAIAIDGEWGAGKTSLMRTVERKLTEKNPSFIREVENSEDFRRCKSVFFNAWKHESTPEILTSLVHAIFEAMGQDGFWSRAARDSTFEHLKDWRSIAVEEIENLTGGMLKIKEYFKSPELLREVPFYDKFRNVFCAFVNAWTTQLSWKEIKALLKSDVKMLREKCREMAKKGVLVIFVDDLDRCPASHVTDVLEAVNLFVDMPGCFFILGMDVTRVADIINEKYKKNPDDPFGRLFLDKIVQLRFQLPPIREKKIEDFVKALGEIGKDIREYLPLIAHGVEAKPRAVKRFLNEYNVQMFLYRDELKRLEKEAVPRYTKFLVLRFSFPKPHELTDDSDLLFAVAKYVAKKQEKEPDVLKKLLKTQKERLIKILEHDSEGEPAFKDRDEIERFKQMSEAVATAETADRGPKPEEEINRDERERMQELAERYDNDMVEVPGGKFFYTDEKDERPLDTFKIDRYPVTNAQFKRFIDDTGYNAPPHWNKRWYKLDERDHPVVNVNFEDAKAYAKWANKELPTEEQWEKAARGGIWLDGDEIKSRENDLPQRKYPWGDEWDSSMCNNNVGGKDFKPSVPGHGKRTTPVGSYPEGASPYGCQDMAGNVWEWTASKYNPEDKSGNADHVLRGGSWINGNPDGFRCASRLRLLPALRNDYSGFRCVVRRGKGL